MRKLKIENYSADSHGGSRIRMRRLSYVLHPPFIPFHCKNHVPFPFLFVIRLVFVLFTFPIRFLRTFPFLVEEPPCRGSQLIARISSKGILGGWDFHVFL